MDAERKVHVAREHLLADARFFGVLGYKMPLIPAVKVKGERIDTMATDGHSIWYNPGYVETLILPEVVGVVMHEIMHKAMGHHLRRGWRDPRLWNEACDYAINPMILAEGWTLPKGLLVKPEWKGLSAEEIYDLLTPPPPSSMVQPKQDSEPDDSEGDAADDGEPDDDGADADSGGDSEADDEQGDGDASDDGADEDEGDGEGADGGTESASDGEGDGEGDDDEGQPDYSKPGKIFEPSNADGTPLTDAQEADEAAALATEVIAAENMARAAGQGSESATRIAEEARNPKADWRDVLREFVAKACITPTFMTWARPNRRFICQGMYLPGWEKQDVGTLVLVIDTSMSIDDAILGRFMLELNRIVEDCQPAGVVVMAVDDDVRWTQTFEQGEAVHVNPLGGGGTRFSPAFAWIAEQGIEPAAVVYFTDLVVYDFGPEPEYPVLFAKWGHYPDRHPFGTVVDINQ